MQGPYDEKYLIEKLISLVREIGRIPSTGDLRLKAHNDHDFPEANTIQGRLGNRHGMIIKILASCGSNPVYSDVVEICGKEKSGAEVHNHMPLSVSPTTEFGYVYLMKSGKFYKIGNSGSPERRQYDVGIKLPEELKIVHKIATDDPLGIEKYWHNRFEEKRKQGEWFDLSGEDVTAFKRRRFM